MSNHSIINLIALPVHPDTCGPPPPSPYKMAKPHAPRTPHGLRTRNAHAPHAATHDAHHDHLRSMRQPGKPDRRTPLSKKTHAHLHPTWRRVPLMLRHAQTQTLGTHTTDVRSRAAGISPHTRPLPRHNRKPHIPAHSPHHRCTQPRAMVHPMRTRSMAPD